MSIVLRRILVFCFFLLHVARKLLTLCLLVLDDHIASLLRFHHQLGNLGIHKPFAFPELGLPAVVIKLVLTDMLRKFAEELVRLIPFGTEILYVRHTITPMITFRKKLFLNATLCVIRMVTFRLYYTPVFNLCIEKNTICLTLCDLCLDHVKKEEKIFGSE